MATYIRYGDGEADTTLQGAEWLRNIIGQQQGTEAAKSFYDNFMELHQDQENQRQYDYGPVFDLFVEHGKDLFAGIPEGRGDERVKDVESFFALVFSMLLMFDDANNLDKATTTLCDVFVSKTKQQPELRLRLLMMLYNTFTPQVEMRFRIFKCTLDYAHQAGLFDQIVPYLEFLDAWMVDWAAYMNEEDKKMLFHDVAAYMKSMGKRVDSFLHLKRYHLLFQGSDKDVLQDKIVYKATVQLLTDAISIPSVIQFDDILSYDTVKAFAKSAEKGDKDLVGLCDVFYQGSVQDMWDFHKKSKALFESHGLEIEDAMSKIRLLTLATLAINRSEMTLAEVAEKLEESEENVERWVVRAISEGVIDGRIDQLNHKVLVKSAFQRKFEKEEWAFLDSKLTQWIDNLDNVIKFIGEQKVLRESVQGSAAP